MTLVRLGYNHLSNAPPSPQGIYMLSTIVQLRTSFPPLPIRSDTDPAEVNLFSTIPEYQLFGSLFDISFLVAAGLSAFGRWASERVNGLQDSG
jgi:hypothetical protein